MKSLYNLGMFLVFFGTFYFLALSVIPSDSDGVTTLGDALSFHFKETYTIGVALMAWSLLLGITSPIVIKVLCLAHAMNDEDSHYSIKTIKNAVLTLCTIGVIICSLALSWPA